MRKLTQIVEDSARLISGYCSVTDCNDCTFSQYDGVDCLFHKFPAQWEQFIMESPCKHCKHPYMGCASDCEERREFENRN